MTAASDYMADATPAAAGHTALRVAPIALFWGQRAFGAILALAALSLWVAPGSQMGGDTMTFRIALSALSLIAGVLIICAARMPAEPEIEIDTAQAELRMVRPGPFGNRNVVERLSFDALGRVQRDGERLKFWDASGSFLAYVELRDRTVREALVARLHGCGHAV